MRRRDLTEEDWILVYRLRVQGKKGDKVLSAKEQALCQMAWKADPNRYNALGKKAALEAAPFGSSQYFQGLTKEED